MKTLTTLVLAAALTGGTFSVQGAQQADRELELCKAEIQDIYGEDTKLSLVDKRHDMNGTSMRVAARLDADNSRFVSCWVPRRGQTGLGFSTDSTGLASNFSASVPDHTGR